VSYGIYNSEEIAKLALYKKVLSVKPIDFKTKVKIKLINTKKDLNSQVANNIRLILNAINMPANHLAKRANLAVNSVHRILREENGITIFTLEQIAKALNLAPDVLLSRGRQIIMPIYNKRQREFYEIKE